MSNLVRRGEEHPTDAEGVRNSAVFVALVRKEWLQDSHRYAEWLLAADLGKPISRHRSLGECGAGGRADQGVAFR